MLNGIYVSIISFYLNIFIFEMQAFNSDGSPPDMVFLGTSIFTCVIWAVSVQIALYMSHFTWIQHAFVWGSIAAWYIIVLAYSSTPVSGDSYMTFAFILAPSPTYWLTTLLVVVLANLPYLAHISYQRTLFPEDHHVIQEIKYYKKDVEDQHMWQREKSKARQETKIGFSARVDAKIRNIKGKLNRKVSTMNSHGHAWPQAEAELERS